MGVRTLVGEFDGTTPAAVMVDSLNDLAFGPLFRGADAYEQVEHFLGWMGRQPFLTKAAEMGLTAHDTPSPLNAHPEDPRAWPDSGLQKLVSFWRRMYIGPDGTLREEAIAS